MALDHVGGAADSAVGTGVGVGGSWACRMSRKAGASKPAYVQTDPWQALSKAFDFCAEPGPNGKLKREGADTIYLMSDGLPFPPGKVFGPDEIVTRTRDWNQLRKIIIHTVFVSAEGTTDYDKGIKFMEQLAKENGGIFKAPKQPKPPGGK